MFNKNLLQNTKQKLQQKTIKHSNAKSKENISHSYFLAIQSINKSRGTNNDVPLDLFVVASYSNNRKAISKQ